MQDFQFEVAENIGMQSNVAEQPQTDVAQNADLGGMANGTSPTPRAALSKRELQIVRMIGMGKTVGNIAVELNLSVKTVSTYRVRALHKLGMLTNADLMRYVISHHLDERESATSENGQIEHTDNGAVADTIEEQMSNPVAMNDHADPVNHNNGTGVHPVDGEPDADAQHDSVTTPLHHPVTE